MYPEAVESVCTCIYLERVERAEVDRDESQPDDAGGVHGKADKLAFVKVLGYLPGLDCVHRADDDQEDVVDQRHQEGDVIAGALEYDDRLTAVRVVQAGAGVLYQQPDGGKEHLHGNQHAGHDNLRLGADKGWPLGRASRTLKYPWDAIGLNEQRGIHNGETETNAEALCAARHRRGRCQQHERHDVADDAPGEQHVAQLPPGRHHHGRVVEHGEEDDDEDGAADAQAGQRHGEDGVDGAPGHVLHLQLEAARLVGVRPPALGARLASLLVADVLPGVALGADPAALLALLDVLDLALLTRLTAPRPATSR